MGVGGGPPACGQGAGEGVRGHCWGPEGPRVQTDAASRGPPPAHLHHACPAGLQPRLPGPPRSKVKARIPLLVGKAPAAQSVVSAGGHGDTAARAPRWRRHQPPGPPSRPRPVHPLPPALRQARPSPHPARPPGRPREQATAVCGWPSLPSGESADPGGREPQAPARGPAGQGRPLP